MWCNAGLCCEPCGCPCCASCINRIFTFPAPFQLGQAAETLARQGIYLERSFPRIMIRRVFTDVMQVCGDVAGKDHLS